MKKVHFLINSGYGRTSGHTTQQHRAFVEEATAMFQSMGWRVNAPDSSHKYPVARSGSNRLYLHPFYFVGQIDTQETADAIRKAAQNASTFGMYGVEYNYTGKPSDLCFPSLQC